VLCHFVYDATIFIPRFISRSLKIIPDPSRLQRRCEILWPAHQQSHCFGTGRETRASKPKEENLFFTQSITLEQAIVYWLSGDYGWCYNLICSSGYIHCLTKFEQSHRSELLPYILNCPSTFGFVARGILAGIGNNDPTALKAFGISFTSPVKPSGTSSLFINTSMLTIEAYYSLL
jgi:hypothetical protein